VRIMPNILSAVGNTPMVRLNNIPKSFGLKCEMGKLIPCSLSSNIYTTLCILS
jgi:hypothetical protein